MSLIQVAVLDDYQGLSKPLFAKLDPSKYQVSYFPDTKLPYNGPNTPQEVKDSLAERLLPYQVICKSTSSIVIGHGSH
jgi:hypothetical protein